MTDDTRAAPTPEASREPMVKRLRHLLLCIRGAAGDSDVFGGLEDADRYASLALDILNEASEGGDAAPLTDLDRFDATNSARIVGKQGGTVPAEPWTTLILRYEATVAALTAERTRLQQQLQNAGGTTAKGQLESSSTQDATVRE